MYDRLNWWVSNLPWRRKGERFYCQSWVFRFVPVSLMLAVNKWEFMSIIFVTDSIVTLLNRSWQPEIYLGCNYLNSLAFNRGKDLNGWYENIICQVSTTSNHQILVSATALRSVSPNCELKVFAKLLWRPGFYSLWLLHSHNLDFLRWLIFAISAAD
jgi:hypothetical protein